MDFGLLEKLPARFETSQSKDNPDLLAVSDFYRIQYRHGPSADFPDNDRKVFLLSTEESKPTSSEARRVDGIDLLRGISILAVILTHVNQRTPIDEKLSSHPLIWQFTSGIFRSGYLGVIVFFVLSGFLITTTSLNRWGQLRNVQIKKFYLIRFARIAPILAALLLVLSLFHVLQIDGFVLDTQKVSLARAVGSALTFQLNWLEASRGGLPLAWSVLWSLSVEEAFYFFFPIACRTLKKELFLLTLLAFVILGPFARTVFSDNQTWLDHSYLSCMDGIALGCLTALFVNKYRISKKALPAIQWSGLVLFLISFFCKRQIYQFGLTDSGLNVTLLESATALLLIAISEKMRNGMTSHSRITAPIRWFGRNSYEVYLTHLFFVIFLTGSHFSGLPGHFGIFGTFVIVLGLSGSFGALIARYFSEPANRWIRSRATLPTGNPAETLLSIRHE